MSISLLCSLLLVSWRWQNSLVCLWTCTDASWGARGRSVHSSPALLAAPLFDGGSRWQGSWIAVSAVAWIHVSTWMQASLQRKLCNAKPTNQLVAYVGQSGDCLRESWVHSLKLAFARSVLSGHCFLTTLFHLVRPTSWKHWPIRLNSVGPSSMSEMKYSGSNHAWSSAMWLVTYRRPCCVPSIWHFKRLLCLQSS